MRIVAVLTAVGAALRIHLAQQSLFADELSTRFVIAGRGLADMVRVVGTDAEITPPLYFVTSWLTTRIETTPFLLRLPSVVAGVATIPLVYVLGARTVGHRAGVVAAALTTFSPFMVFYSTEARGYALMMALVLGAALCLLNAAERGGRGWWAGYAACTCAAVYTHYTSVFALAGLFVWAVATQRHALRALLVATGVAVIGFLPWLGGLRVDLDAPTTDILSNLQPFSLDYVRASLSHWAIGYPYAQENTRIAVLPGTVPAILFVLAVAVGAVRLAVAAVRDRARPRPAALLAVALFLSVPVGEALASAVSDNVFGSRNLAAGWPGLALCLGAVLLAAGRRLGPALAVVAVGVFVVGTVKLTGPAFERPPFERVVAYVDRTGQPGDAVVDAIPTSPDGVPSALDVGFAERRRVYALERFAVRYDPFRIVGAPPPTEVVVRRATGAGRRVFMVTIADELGAEALAALPSDYLRVSRRSFNGLRVWLYAPAP